MVWFWIITSIVGLMAIGQIFSILASRKADMLLKKMERQYEAVIEVLLANAYLKDDNWEAQDEAKLVQDCLQMLKPHIESLLAYINTVEEADVKITYPTKYFSNIASFADSLFQKRHKHKETPLTQAEKEEMYANLQDALTADVMKRRLYLSVGRL